MAAIETIAGGVIAGAVGLATVKYERRIERQDRKRRWESRFEALIDLFKWPMDDDVFQAYHDPHIDHSYIERLRWAIEAIDNHIANAERDFSEEFWEQYRVVVHVAATVADIREPGTNAFERDGKHLEREANVLRGML